MNTIRKNLKWYLLAALFLANLFVWHAVFAGAQSSRMIVAFLDVGQGDATFIETPSGKQILIDGGPNKKILQELSAVMPFYDRSIDVVIATHPDQDHIGGLPFVLERFDVGVVMVSGNESQTATNDSFEKAVDIEGTALLLSRRGQVVDFGDGVTLSILYPDRDVSKIESNTASIVARLIYGDTEILLTGDAPKSIERYLVSLDGKNLQSDVLKVGHHGSKTSTDKIFLAAVAPEYAVISAGENNRYGHPHADVTALLNDFNILIKETKNGTIILQSNGRAMR